MGGLSGKLALVTGGAHGVGRAIAAELASRGAHVLINYFHSHEAAKETRAALEADGARVDLLRASVARQDQAERMFAQIEERFGGLDILVNNAANGALVPGTEVTDALLDKAIDTNYKGSLRCSRLAAPLMAGRGGGSIVMLSALGCSQFVMANYLACAPAKAAAETVARYLAVEFAPMNIRVNTATASMLVSEVAEKFPDAADMQRVVREATPMGRLGEPEEFAALVGFLASDESRWITGQEIVADGGLSLGAAMLSPSGTLRPPAPPPAAPAEGKAEDGLAAAAHEAHGTDQEQETDQDHEDEIAVVGMGLTVAGANSPEEFWRVRLDGADLCIPVPPDRWALENFHSEDITAEDKSYQDKSVFITGFVPDERSLDGLPEGAHEHDMTTRWLRHCLLQAMDGVSTAGQDRYSFLVGYTPDGSQHLEEAGVIAAAVDHSAGILDGMDLPPEQRADLLAKVRDTLTGRYWRGAQSPSRFLPHRVGQLAMSGVLPDTTELHMVDTACSSSLYALDIGIKGLLMGKQDIAVCGGAFALGPRGSVLFSKLNGLSKRGDLRSLDADADGVVFADGAAVVVLKRLSRARADGDRVLAVLKGFGSSSDGKGKAVYAPNSHGQELAVRRALTGSGTAGADVDWIIAHATGTPAGDLAEFTMLRKHFGTGHRTHITSNKSLFGHTGWAAGVVSLIEAILGLEHETIPPQHHFDRTPEDFRIGETTLEVPVRPRPWPRRDGRARAVAISGFGFGGTNAHLIVREDLPHRRVRERRPLTGRSVIVGLSAHLPGLDGHEGLKDWLRGGTGPEDSFGEFYPVPPLSEVRMPPPTARTIDRCQLMILRCARDLREQLGELWEAGRQCGGVFVGNLGPTRAAMLYAERCYLDDIGRALAAEPSLAGSTVLPELMGALRDAVRRRIPASNEDSFPGIMPNVISARVANYFDLKGPNITLDSGLSSTLSALDTAHRYLLAGELEFALVGGINGNALPAYRTVLADLLPTGQDGLSEGAFTFALTTEANAERYGLPVLGRLGAERGDGPVIECGVSSPGHARYLGAAGGLALAQALHGPAGRVSLVCDQDGGGPKVHVDLTVTGHHAVAAPGTEGSRGVLPERFRSSREYAGGKPVEISRYVPRLREFTADDVREPLPFLTEGTVVLTDQPQLLDGVPVPPGTLVVSTGGPVPARPGWHHLPEPTPRAVRDCLAQTSSPIRHLRLLGDFGTVSPDMALASAPPGINALMRLHDAAFLVLQNRYDDMAADGSSFVSLFLRARPDGREHPCLGLFSGLVKCIRQEFADCLVYGVFTERADTAEAIGLAERESAAHRPYPVVHYGADGTRRIPALSEEPVTVPEQASPALDRESVVLATGGARGITAEVMKEVARTFRSRIYLLGSNPLSDHPAEVLAGTDEEFAAGRPGFIRREMAARRGVTVAVLNREFDRMLDARAAHRNIAEMARYSGKDRVTYLTCDVLDHDAVDTAIATVLERERGIDLVVNAAGRNRGASIKEKDFAEFRAIRDLKVRGYRNLKRALRDSPPRMWCNFGSLLGYSGLAGEVDYGSGNDFLDSAARHAAADRPRTDEFTVGWTLWDGVGIGANELTKAYFKRGGSYTHMAVGEGVHHFVRELHAANRHPFVVHMGAAERVMVHRLHPGYFQPSSAPPPHPPDHPSTPDHPHTPNPPYLHRTVSLGTGEAAYEFSLDAFADDSLNHHLVRGMPTLPGAWVTEIAAEAARALVGGLEVIGFTDLTFEHFLRAYPGRPGAPKRITARVVERTREVTAVRVRITADVISPQGVLLVRDKPLSSATVLLAQRFPAAPLWPDWTADGETPMPDPYHLDTSPVRLTGPFLATSATRLHIFGKRAHFAPGRIADGTTLSRFTVPAVLLDAMLRLEALSPFKGNLLPVAVPLSIRRIDLYQRANDRELIAEHGGLELYGTPAASTVDMADPRNRFVATTADGRVVAQIKDVRAGVTGHIDPDTGWVRETAATPRAPQIART